MNIIVKGNKRLSGTVCISGSKNSVLAIIPACLLTKGIVRLENVPRIEDVFVLLKILKIINVEYEFIDDVLIIDSSNVKDYRVTDANITKIRGSYYLMGVLLGLFNKVEINYPGGCSLGGRPIDYHLNGFEKLGCEVQISSEDVLYVSAKKIVGVEIELEKPSVGATVNIMLAAVKAKGTTIIKNAAKEPEIEDVGKFCNSIGANIEGLGSSVITINGVHKLNQGTYRVMGDRIEAGTYAVIGALCGEVKILGIDPKYLTEVLKTLKLLGSVVNVSGNQISVKRGCYNSFAISTKGYPGFPTDLQQIFAVIATQCLGVSIIEENIFKARYASIKELDNLGANTLVLNRYALIFGPSRLIGARVKGMDLRGTASLVIAGLIAENETIIENVEFMERGYCNFVKNLKSLGADIDYM